jgi:hypothetical protein
MKIISKTFRLRGRGKVDLGEWPTKVWRDTIKVRLFE